MKIRITLKGSDAIDHACKEKARSILPEDAYDYEISEETKNIRSQLKSLVKWGEYITVELDTETGTGIVIPLKDC